MRESHVEILSSEFQRAAVFPPQQKAAQMSTASRVRGSAQVFKAALIYFGVVFGTGFVLGTIRVLWSVPRFGERNAELLEQPLMLIAVVLAARWTVRRDGSALAPIEGLAIGLVALGLLVAAELLVVLELRGLSLSEYVRTRDPVSGTVYLLMLGVFALMPWVILRRRVASIKEKLTC
jgi:hypothetical protein